MTPEQMAEYDKSLDAMNEMEKFMKIEPEVFRELEENPDSEKILSKPEMDKHKELNEKYGKELKEGKNPKKFAFYTDDPLCML